MYIVGLILKSFLEAVHSGPVESAQPPGSVRSGLAQCSRLAACVCVVLFSRLFLCDHTNPIAASLPPAQSSSLLPGCRGEGLLPTAAARTARGAQQNGFSPSTPATFHHSKPSRALPKIPLVSLSTHGWPVTHCQVSLEGGWKAFQHHRRAVVFGTSLFPCGLVV